VVLASNDFRFSEVGEGRRAALLCLPDDDNRVRSLRCGLCGRGPGGLPGTGAGSRKLEAYLEGKLCSGSSHFGGRNGRTRGRARLSPTGGSSAKRECIRRRAPNDPYCGADLRQYLPKGLQSLAAVIGPAIGGSIGERLRS